MKVEPTLFLATWLLEIVANRVLAWGSSSFFDEILSSSDETRHALENFCERLLHQPLTDKHACMGLVCACRERLT
ncbi:hypothetical protein ACFX2I_045916 [Malus domestica]